MTHSPVLEPGGRLPALRMAFPHPASRGNRMVAPPPGNHPCVFSSWPNRTLALATRMSDHHDVRVQGLGTRRETTRMEHSAGLRKIARLIYLIDRVSGLTILERT
jgi:hypothetical protein